MYTNVQNWEAAQWQWFQGGLAVDASGTRLSGIPLHNVEGLESFQAEASGLVSCCRREIQDRLASGHTGVQSH